MILDSQTRSAPARPIREPAPPRQTPRRFGDYLLLERLGQGDTGIVYRARSLTRQRDVALKVLLPHRQPAAIRRLAAEVELGTRLRHPHLLLPFEFGREGDAHYQAREWIDGETAADLLRRRVRLPAVEACRLALQAALALDCLDRHGIVHRDLKPGNLLLERGSGRVRLADLSLALDRCRRRPAAPEPPVGTPLYVAPEQIVDSGAADVRSDLYALGAALFHLLAGVPPFAGSTAAEILRAHLRSPAPSLDNVVDGLPPGLGRVVLCLLEKDPAQRFQTPREFADALLVCLG